MNFMAGETTSRRKQRIDGQTSNNVVEFTETSEWCLMFSSRLQRVCFVLRYPNSPAEQQVPSPHILLTIPKFAFNFFIWLLLTLSFLDESTLS
jgi:hypothetical protein